MTWVKIDDTLPGNPKVRGVPLAARWTYISSICYSNLHKLNGDIQRNMLGTLDGNPKIADQLMAAGLWEPRPFGWYIHDYLRHNRSKELIDQRSETYRTNAFAKANSKAISSEKPEQLAKQVALSPSASVLTPLPEKPLDLPQGREREANSSANSSQPWDSLSREEQDTFHEWAKAIGERFVFRPDSSDLVGEMVQAVEEITASVIRQGIRACRSDNVKPWPRELRQRLPGANVETDDLEDRKNRYLSGPIGQRLRSAK